MKMVWLTATQALTALSANQRSVVELLEACLQRIAERQAAVRAWEFLQPEAALQLAQCYEQERQHALRAGTNLRTLHGIPIGIKDTLATADMPTRWGTPIYANQQFAHDAAVVERLRAAGAIILGKTVTSEYAISRPGDTRNPHNLEHTPGASSSGSAAAVADYMVPVAIGTQMVGSILRPAAYCGIIGFKPTAGTISRYGVMPSSRELDQVGILARSIDDIARVLHTIAGVDPRDPDCQTSLLTAEPLDHPLRFALIRTPYWSQIEAEAERAFFNSAAAFRAWGATVTEVALPVEFDRAFEHVTVLAAVGMATHHGADYDRYAEQMSVQLQQWIERGRTVTPIAHIEALQAAQSYRTTLSTLLSDYDAVLTPVTTGTAPQGLEQTGSPIFCALWTLCGLPTISIPAGVAHNGLPLGIQLVGKHAGDWNLLMIADWVITCLEATGQFPVSRSEIGTIPE